MNQRSMAGSRVVKIGFGRATGVCGADARSSRLGCGRGGVDVLRRVRRDNARRRQRRRLCDRGGARRRSGLRPLFKVADQTSRPHRRHGDKRAQPAIADENAEKRRDGAKPDELLKDDRLRRNRLSRPRRGGRNARPFRGRPGPLRSAADPRKWPQRLQPSLSPSGRSALRIGPTRRHASLRP